MRVSETFAFIVQISTTNCAVRVTTLSQRIERFGGGAPASRHLGTDGFGRSDNREHLRKHFEVNAESIVGATLSKLSREGKFKPKQAQKAMAELGLDVEAADPAKA